MNADRKEKPNSPPFQSEPTGNHLLAAYQHAPIGIVGCSPEGHYTLVNEEFCRLTGYQQEELLGRSIRDISFQEDYEEEWKLYEKLIAGEIASYKFERRSMRKDGTFIWEIGRASCRERV